MYLSVRFPGPFLQNESQRILLKRRNDDAVDVQLFIIVERAKRIVTPILLRERVLVFTLSYLSLSLAYLNYQRLISKPHT